MKDTFKKFGKDALNTAKNEISAGVESAKTETTNHITESIDSKKSSTTNIGEKLAKKATGAGDLLAFKDITSTNSIIQKLLTNDEQVYFFLQSIEEELAFTNKAIIHSKKNSMTSSKSLTTRFELNNTLLANIRIETAGTVDRDAELKFVANDQKFSFDITKTQLDTIIDLYMSLINISKRQKQHLTKLENLQFALTTASSSTNLNTEMSQKEAFISIAEYSEQRLNDMILVDFSSEYVN